MQNGPHLAVTLFEPKAQAKHTVVTCCACVVFLLFSANLRRYDFFLEVDFFLN